ncbi:MAG: transporter [Flavobacteriales bacterium]|nr:transporter [Flavobacteriales bacterium]
MKGLFLFVVCALGCLNVSAGAWTLHNDTLVVKLSFFTQQTSYRYASSRIFCGDAECLNGQHTTYLFSGRLESYAGFLNLNYGITDKLEVLAQIPYYNISFIDEVDPNRARTKAVGDLVFGARYNFFMKPFVYTLKINSKAPTGFFNKDAEVVPVGDGQWDIQVVNQFGKSLYPIKGYVNVDLGYKVRFAPNPETSNLDPGDEIHLNAEVGYNVYAGLWAKMGVAGFWGQEFTASFANSELQLSDSERRILYLTPGIYWEINPNWAFDLTIKYTLSGKNYPAGFVYGTGIAYKMRTRNKLKK